jgi:hypothetical protein
MVSAALISTRTQSLAVLACFCHSVCCIVLAHFPDKHSATCAQLALYAPVRATNAPVTSCRCLPVAKHPLQHGSDPPLPI